MGFHLNPRKLRHCQGIRKRTVRGFEDSPVTDGIGDLAALPLPSDPPGAEWGLANPGAASLPEPLQVVAKPQVLVPMFPLTDRATHFGIPGF